MKNRIAILGVLILTFVFMTGMALPGVASSPGCSCDAHASANGPAVR